MNKNSIGEMRKPSRRLYIILFMLFSGILLQILPSISNSSEKLDFSDFGREGKWRIGSGIGFTLDPDAFLLTEDIDYFLLNEISVGSSAQFAVSDNVILFNLDGTFRYLIDIDAEGFLRRLKPNISTAAGFALVHLRAFRGVSDTDMGVHFSIGPG
jgi:hypothetical protein